MTQPPFIQLDTLPVRHGFFTRAGGVSTGAYESLNGGLGTEDSPEAVQENRKRMVSSLGLGLEQLAALDQVHGAGVRVLRHVQDIWPLSHLSAPLPEGDAMVTDCPDLALGIATADCAPVLFSSADGRIVGAAHAGWRGAVAGVLEATVAEMRALGAEGIHAVIGPCIGPVSYEVSEDMRQAVLARQEGAESFFTAVRVPGQYQFDLPGFCLSLLGQQDVQAQWSGHDTAAESRFFSHRRATLGGDGRTGRQIAVIRAGSGGKTARSG